MKTIKKFIPITIILIIFSVYYFNRNEKPAINYETEYLANMEVIHYLTKQNISTDYEKYILSLDTIILNAKSEVLKIRVIKSRDSLLEIKNFFTSNYLEQHFFKFRNQFLEFKEYYISIKSKGYDFCEVYREYGLIEKTVYDIANDVYSEDYNKQNQFIEKGLKSEKIKYLNKNKGLTKDDLFITSIYGYRICK